jgi:putative protease
VFHAASQGAADLVPLHAGVRRLRVELVRESAAETARIVEHYRRLVVGTLAPADLWRALRTGGGYRVVRGSLRVIDA